MSYLDLRLQTFVLFYHLMQGLIVFLKFYNMLSLKNLRAINATDFSKIWTINLPLPNLTTAIIMVIKKSRVHVTMRLLVTVILNWKEKHNQFSVDIEKKSNGIVIFRFICFIQIVMIWNQWQYNMYYKTKDYMILSILTHLILH